MNVVKHMDQLSNFAGEYLIDKYNAHTVILYGSRARGDATETSDIDIACFCDDIAETKEAGLFHDVYLDAWIYPTECMKSLSEKSLRFSEGIVLYDKYGYGADYLSDVQNFLHQGPQKLSSIDREHVMQWIYKMLKRIESADLQANYRKVWLQFELLESYFKLRDIWFLGDKRSFIWLKQYDIKAYKLFSDVYNNPSNNEGLKLLADYVTNRESCNTP